MKTIKQMMGMALIVVAGGMMAACGNNQAEQPAAPAAKGDGQQQCLKVAYIEVDSIMTQYQMAVDNAAALQKESESIKTTLQKRAAAIQQEGQELQSKMETGQVTRDQAMQMQQALQKKMQQAQNLEASLTEKYQAKVEAYNAALHDSIQSFLQSYNKQLGYDYILSKTGDNMLLANPKYNVTEDVIKGLNKRYKPAK